MKASRFDMAASKQECTMDWNLEMEEYSAGQLLLLPLDKPERVGVGAGDVVERVVEPVDGDGLTPRDAELLRVNIAGLLSDGAELEGQAERVGEVGEAFPRCLERVHGRAEAGEPDPGRAAGAGGEDVEEPRPLQPLHDVEVDDVHAVLPLERLLDGLVGGEVRELDEGADAVEHLERRGGDAAAVQARRHGVPRRQRRVDAQAGGHEARRHGLREVGRHAVRRGAERRGQLRDLQQAPVRVVEVVRVHGLRALQQEGEQVEPFLVPLPTPLLLLPLLGGLGRLRWRRRVVGLLVLLRRRRTVLLCGMKRRRWWWSGRERGDVRSGVQERWMQRRGVGGGEEGAEAELEEGGETGVAGVDDLADVVDELRHGHPGPAAAPDDVADDAVDPRRRGGRRRRRNLSRLRVRRGDVHTRGLVLVRVRLELVRGGQLGGQRGQLRAGGERRQVRRGRTSSAGTGGDVGEVARDVAARRREVDVGRGALADHGGGGGVLLLLVLA